MKQQTTEATPLKKWNEDIEISLPLDYVANMLHKSLNPENPHRNLITNTIIGVMKEDDRIVNLYTSLTGFRKEIDFEVGQKAYCVGTTHIRDEGLVEIGDCTIVAINEYAKYGNVQISYPNKDNNEKLIETWVNIQNLKQPDSQEVEKVLAD